MNRFKNLIGLSYKARKLVIGTDNIIKNINISELIIVTKDLSNDSFNKIKNKSEDLIPIVFIDDEKALSASLGLKNIKAVSIIDKGFKELILDSLK